MQSFHYLAYMLDPRKKGNRRLTMEQQNEGEEWLNIRHPNFVPFVLAFTAEDTEIYPSSMFRESVVKTFSAAKWWKILISKISATQEHDAHPENAALPLPFCQFVFNLHSVPVLSASLEKIFSNFSYIWSTTRNRLGTEKMAKLAKVYCHLREANDN
nr:uncharacterized protein LOC105846975 [Hydra vulgaris]